MLALPAAPAAAPRRQILVGTALACAAGVALIGSMIATWVTFRNQALNSGAKWLPKGVAVPEVASNVMLIAFLPACVFAQWAVYSAKRNDNKHVGLALGLTALIGVMVINAQAYIYKQMAVPAKGGAYNSMFYAITAVFLVLMIIGVIFSVVTAIRYLGGRSADREVVSAHALYWYFLAAAFAVVWFVVYVTK
ncbi:MAG TPA: cytochrome c oxidase subunit 3 [Ilumatobacteraceae bacterium]|nr:cytochrome c oxidase subunit 3 [Ilumatobacteraceae bacterium]